MEKAGGIAMILYPDNFDEFKKLIIEINKPKRKPLLKNWHLKGGDT